MSEEERAFYLAFRYLLTLSAHLERGTIHLRDNTGRLLQTLDEWWRAVEAGRWPPPEDSVNEPRAA